MILIDLIAGARPNFMKIASLIAAKNKMPANSMRFNFRLIHTGQHYDEEMSGNFFSQLNIPSPDINFNVGPGSHAEQTSKIMCAYENLLEQTPSDMCIVVGDVNSTMACAITAKKKNVLVSHIEAGLRSYDWNMPEEVNRVVTDAISDYFFTTTEIASKNLLDKGVKRDRIFFVGNTMIDNLLNNSKRICKPRFWNDFNLQHGKYFLLTLHRPANVDQDKKLLKILETISYLSRGLPILFPIHPRTSKILSKSSLNLSNLFFVEPQPYLEFIYLEKHAKAIITDSGGVTEEATVLKIPCMTIRDNTERPETVDIGTNVLIGTDPTKFEPIFSQLFEGDWKKAKQPTYWDGKAGHRIIEALDNIFST